MAKKKKRRKAGVKSPAYPSRDKMMRVNRIKGEPRPNESIVAQKTIGMEEK